jgi:hypothetical protein
LARCVSDWRRLLRETTASSTDPTAEELLADAVIEADDTDDIVGVDPNFLAL